MKATRTEVWFWKNSALVFKFCKGFGVQFIVIACNTLHTFLNKNNSPNELINIVDCVGKFVANKKIDTLLVLGTQTTVRQGLYKDCAEKVVYLNHAQQKALERIINRVLAGKCWKRDRTYITNLVRLFRKRRKANAVILGCTELSVLFRNQKNKASQLIDPLMLLAKEVLLRDA